MMFALSAASGMISVCILWLVVVRKKKRPALSLAANRQPVSTSRPLAEAVVWLVVPYCPEPVVVEGPAADVVPVVVFWPVVAVVVLWPLVPYAPLAEPVAPVAIVVLVWFV